MVASTRIAASDVTVIVMAFDFFDSTVAIVKLVSILDPQYDKIRDLVL